MKEMRGNLSWLCLVVAAAAWLCTPAYAEDHEPVTRVTPAVGEGPSASSPAPEATPAPEAAPLPVVSPAPVTSSQPTQPIPSPSPAAVPAAPSPMASPEASGSAPAASGTAPVSTGTTATLPPRPPSPYSIEIDLQHQRAYLLKDGMKIAESPISSGRAGHLTPTGNFEVIQKDLNHFSNLYGKIVEKGSGRLVKSGADSAMPVPKGCKFVPAPMKWFLRFEGAAGMHAGILPGYPASHGCVRMPASRAQLFYETVDLGTPVHVFGNTPVRDTGSGESHHHRAAGVAAVPSATPTPPPPRKRGWWLF